MKSFAYMQLVLSIIAMSVLSCERTNDDPIPIKDFIIAGETNNLIVSQYDSIISINKYPYEYPEISEFQFDIDQDQINDILIKVSGFGTSHFGTAIETSMDLLHNNIGFYARKIIDTIYLVDQRVFIGTDGNLNTSIVYENVYSNQRLHSNDSLVSIRSTQSDTICALHRGDTIWNSSTFLVNNISPTPNRQEIYCCDTLSFLNDTAIVIQEIYNYYNLGNISYSEDLFFGVELNGKIGFVKIKFHDQYKVEVYYSAIQKSE